MFSFSFAFAQTRTPLPGGASIVLPSPYRSKTEYPKHGAVRGARKVADQIAVSFQA